MKHSIVYDEYPRWIVFLSNAVQMAVVLVGALIIGRLGGWWLLLYLALVAFLEFRLLTRSCVNCFYYGKRCAFGKGKLCAALFRKGDPDSFRSDAITWKDLLPDFLVSLIPMTAGIALSFLRFSWSLVYLVIALFLLAFPATGFIRSLLACRFCRQRELGCPAEQLFSKSSRAQ